MSRSDDPAPWLVFGIGNPSRGDDALGPRFVAAAEVLLAREIAAGEVECLTDFQLQIEHALDIAGRARVVFVDASVAAPAPLSCEVLTLADGDGWTATTHALSPRAVVATLRAMGREVPPRVEVWAIRGERFELGEGLSTAAEAHLAAALARLVAAVRGGDDERGVRIALEGTVQGVGFRPWVVRVARGLGLRGRVVNTARGVSIEALGAAAGLAALARALREDLPPGARVRCVHEEALGAGSPDGPQWTDFGIGDSTGVGPLALSLPADLAPCAACTTEVVDCNAPGSHGALGNRHFGYPFTSCTACGPRFAIVTGLPYDRAATALGGFALCDDCAREYADPEDRRFHAQAVACPACGPRVWLADTAGVPSCVGADAIAAAAARLAGGEVIGVQGLGGFHLACDATNPEAVATLRARKGREAKPFAVMARDLAEAETLAALDDAARRALVSVARPIVLCAAAPGVTRLAPNVGAGASRVGLLLPYTPLHQVLMAAVDGPLVMTSGNLGDAPIALTQADALHALTGLVDAFLFHDRPMVRRVEDSIVSSARNTTQVVRRSRGFVPEPIRLPVAAPEPILAVGGHLKNTACLVVGDLAYLTPHLGDLASFEAETAWQAEVEGFERLLGVRAEVLAHDLHPDYATTRYALARPARQRIAVQHHAAHVLATAAELGLDEPLLGVVFDGSGYGVDASGPAAWGAEFLRVDDAAWTRRATFRPLSLSGGERAIREAWRAGYAALIDAFGAEAPALAERLALFREVPASARETLARALATGVGVVRAHGMGRWFDAIGALVLGTPRAAFEGQVAIAWEDVAASAGLHPSPARAPYPFEITHKTPPRVPEIDLRPMVRAVVGDHLAGITPGTISARFHQTIVAATAHAIDTLGLAHGVHRVVLSGGAFQNRRLTAGLIAALGADRVALGREVPVNDGGLALGQAYAAVLALRQARATALALDSTGC